MEASLNVTVIGLGAMGGGMARTLLESTVTRTVTGYDVSESLTGAFFIESVKANKAPSQSCPASLLEAITTETQFVVLVLQNEPQCDEVCFGSTNNPVGNNNNSNNAVLSLLQKKSVVILCSTVTPTWAKKASKIFEEHDIYFIDCPISGGPVRARSGELTLLSSANQHSYTILNQLAKPILEAMSRQNEWYIIEGGSGMGSTVKMVHQLLAGVHIVVAAEALALAAKAGLDVEQVYNIVNGAAGASWMFKDRGERMLMDLNDDKMIVRSQLQIFIKDLDIVYAEAKRLQSPIPLASVALQQYISAQGLGLGKHDDSAIKRVYEQISGVPILAASSKKTKATGSSADVASNDDGWLMEDGSYEPIVEVGMEPRHKVIVQNEYVRAIRVNFPPNDTTLAHKHSEDSLYFFLVESGLNVINHVQGYEPLCDCMEYGEVRYGPHKSDKPLVHKITNKTSVPMHCIDAELLKVPPILCPLPLICEYHECIKTRDRCRVYKLTLQPGQSVITSYPFFHCTVIVLEHDSTSSTTTTSATIEKSLFDGKVKWSETVQTGDFAWKEPIVDLTKRNIGTTPYVEYIAEWR